MKTPAKRVLMAAVAALSLLAPAGSTLAADSTRSPFTAAQLRAALAAMPPDVAAVRRPLFTSSRYVVVAYAQTVQPFDRQTGRPVGAAKSLALGAVTPAATASITNLAVRISITYDRELGCCNWNIQNSFDWTGVPPNGTAGKDQLGSAWANGLALKSDTAFGKYTGTLHNIPMNRNDVTPNVGTSWEFNECEINAPCNQVYANYGYLFDTITETSRHNQSTNVVFKYFHTWASISYAISFSTAPGISISPVTSVSPTTVYTTFVN